MGDPRSLPPAGEMKVFLGLAVQPVAAALLAFFAFPLLDYTGRAFGLYSGHPIDAVDAAVSVAFGVGIVALVVTVLAALPCFVWLLHRGRITRRNVLMSGALLGNAPSLLFATLLVIRGVDRGTTPREVPMQAVYGPLGAVRLLVFGSFIGVSCAAVFWWLTGRHLGVRSGTANQPGQIDVPVAPGGSRGFRE